MATAARPLDGNASNNGRKCARDHTDTTRRRYAEEAAGPMTTKKKKKEEEEEEVDAGPDDVARAFIRKVLQ